MQLRINNCGISNIFTGQSSLCHKQILIRNWSGCQTVHHTLTSKCTQGSLDLTAKDQRQSLHGAVLTLWSDWRVFSTFFCLVSRNLIDKGWKKIRSTPYPSCSGTIQVLYKGHRMVLHLLQERLKEGVVLSKLLNERASYSDRYQALPFCLPARLSCGCPSLNKAALQFPCCPGAHSLSLLRMVAVFSPSQGPKQQQLCSLPWPTLLPTCSPRKPLCSNQCSLHFHSSYSQLGLLCCRLTARSLTFLTYYVLWGSE